MKRTLLSLLLLAPAALLTAQTTGGISAGMLEQIKKAQPQDAGQQALRNAVTGASLQSLAMPMSARSAGDTHFSHRVRTKGITDQQKSGRCWLFTGLNVMRSRMITKYNLGAFEFSQSYCFFYDQLEKSNLFLQSAIDLAKLPMDDKKVDWLFHNPLSDGGTFCGVQDVVTKYGLVPAEVMPETFSANNTSQMSTLIATKLREYGLELRAMVANGAKAKALNDRKTQMLGTVYHMLSLCLGEPPVSFTWTRKDAQGNPVDTREYTPLSFYQTYVGADLKGNYVMLMNDPSRPYHKTYTIDMDRHSYDGQQWTYLNLPMEEIKAMAIASIKDSTMMYYSCDVGKFLNSKTGVLSLDNFDYASLMGTTFPMNKADRIRTFASASSHAMTLVAVDLDANGKPKKWMVENSWGPSSGYQGHLIMTDEWFDEYSFRLVVERKYVPAATLELLKQKPTVLPAWDPLFQMEE
ncbi:MAG: C1 family peptidase [Bacteroidales bacterium]|nr:C1 family peptidase [Bacteroidales bacterium]MDY6032616.1 C1 family peptidase [Alloprevotella sp.]